MSKLFKKVMSTTLVASVFASLVMNDAISFTYATDNNIESEYAANDSGYYTALDMDGNVTLIPYDELETTNIEEIEAIDNVEYEVIVTVDGEDNVVATLATEVEAEAEAAVIQEIIDDNSTEDALAEIGITTDETPVATPLEIILDDEDAGTVEEVVEIETEQSGTSMVFSVTAAAVSTQSSATTTDTTTDVTVSTMAVTQAVSYGVVTFTNTNSQVVTNYTDASTGAAGYLNAISAPDAAYLGTVGDKVMFMQSGVIGLVSASEVSVTEYDSYVAAEKKISYYTTSNGRLYHVTVSSVDKGAREYNTMVGYQQSYMTNGGVYYSYDGIYFYTSYKTMVADYVAGTYANAINYTEPYYNYYLYLSQRSTTSYTAEQINEYLTYKLTSNGYSDTSLLTNSGAAFIEYQNTYGINALLTLGISINESSWGTSDIALAKNNLFGHGANDSNPYYDATGYSVATDSIKYHMELYMSKSYTNPKGTYYYGAHLGNKGSGANVKYASDPYWGEKAAAQCYYIEEYFSTTTVDYNTYTIGITSGKVLAYNSPGGTSIYNTLSSSGTTLNNVPVIILESVEYNGETWYKIQSDGPVSSDRSSILTTTYTYNFTTDYVYVLASDVYVVGDVVPEADTIYPRGDVNMDTVVNASDYMMIKGHLMGWSVLTGQSLAMANAIDGDSTNAITASDYMLIKGHIMGWSSLE